MNKEDNTPVEPRDMLDLKLPQPDVSAKQPWNDDVLGREATGKRLTNLVSRQSTPFVISVHGHWGTGKTFLLERWQKDLEQQGYKAIYFNAWEDDFYNDPLVAILGQMFGHLEGGFFESLVSKIAENAIPLIRQNALGILGKQIGLDFTLDQSGQGAKRNPLEEYAAQRASKDELKKRLTEASSKVMEETGHPLIFIVDELDRCRPTFAVELIERVKHIFDVPNMVFVFGINRDQLCASLRSIYGDIDADIYIRRFFDLGFTLPEVDSAEFTRHLMERYKLGDYFNALSIRTNNRTPNAEFSVLANCFPLLCSRFGLSLRDIDSCVRTIALACKSVEPRHFIYPWLLSLLVPLGLKNPTLYLRFVKGNCYAGEVMDYVDGLFSLGETDRGLTRVLSVMEAEIYLVEPGNRNPGLQWPGATEQLELLKKGEALTHPEYLSARTKRAGAPRADRLLEIIQGENHWNFQSNAIDYLTTLIDLPRDTTAR